MVKVLEEKPVPRAEVRCPGCGSLLEYGNADLREDHRFDAPYSVASGGKLFRNYKLTCPVCGVDVAATWIDKEV